MQRKSKHLWLAVVAALVAAFTVFRVNEEPQIWDRLADRFEPRIRLAPLPGATPYSKDYDFSEDWFTFHIAVWNNALASFKGKPNIHYLEIGLYEGRSAIWMLENILTHPSARLTGIDIFSGAVKERFLANVERSGATDKVTTIIGYSQVELRKLSLGSFDVIYIDGSHRADDVLEDAVLSWRLLKEGGVLIFDDYRWNLHWPPEERPKIALNAFRKFYGRHFEVIHDDYQLIMRKNITR